MKVNVNSNAQEWGLKVVCKNKAYMQAAVRLLSDEGVSDFRVECEEFQWLENSNDFEGRWTITISSCWFRSLSRIARKLKKIESRLGD